MSEGFPRWPGTDGSPGLDFGGSRVRTADSPAAPASQPSAPVSQPSVPASQPSAPASQPSAPASGSSAPISPSSARESGTDRNPAYQETPPHRPSAPSRAAPDPLEDSAPPVPAPTTRDSVPRPASTPARREEDNQTHLIAPVKDDDPDPRSAASAKAFSTQSTTPWQSRISDAAIEVPVRASEPSSVTVPAAAGAVAGAAVPQRSAPERKSRSYPRGARRTRKARLRLARIDPWSVMKTAFLFSIAFGVMMVVISSVLWSVLSGSGALESLDSFLAVLLGDGQNNPFQLEDYLNTSRVLGFATLIAAIDVVILTAVATLFAFLYNLAATIIGGLEVTLAED